MAKKSPTKKPTKKGKPSTKTASARKPATRTRAQHTKALRATLASVPSQPHAARTDLRVPGLESTGAGLEATGAGGLTFVAVVSNDGPWELRSLVINDFQILDTTIPTSQRRIDVPIPAVLGSPLAITWAILAAQLMPSVGTFVEEPGQTPVALASKGPLKKGESWAPLLPVTFPKA